VGYGINLPALKKTPRKAVLPVVAKLFARNLAFWTGKRTTFFGLTRTAKHFKPDLETLFGLLESGGIAVPIKATFRLEEIQAASGVCAKRRARGNYPRLECLTSPSVEVGSSRRGTTRAFCFVVPTSQIRDVRHPFAGAVSRRRRPSGCAA
jgi:hypothetical protein